MARYYLRRKKRNQFSMFLRDKKVKKQVKVYDAQIKEIALTIRRASMTLIGLCFFCMLSLSVSDKSLFFPTGKIDEIKVPFAGLNISYSAFLIVGPILLISVSIYLHIFYQQLNKLKTNTSNLFPTLFSMDNVAAKIVSEFILYWMVPVVMLRFSWRALPKSESSWAIPFYLSIITAFMVLRLLKFKLVKKNVMPYLTLIVCPVFIGLPLFLIPMNLHFNKITGKGFYLKKMDLADMDLRGIDFSYANLEEAKLTGANLMRADLSNANLKRADFTKAKLSNAKFVNADLEGASMIGVELQESNLEHADFTNANLKGANLSNTKVMGADFSLADLVDVSFESVVITMEDLGINKWSVKFDGADLSTSNFSNVKLPFASFVNSTLKTTMISNAELEFSDFSGGATNLNGAVLKNVNLIGSNFEDAELKGTFLSEKTYLRFANLRNVDFSGAKFDDVYLDGSNMEFSKMLGANLANTEMNGTILKNAEIGSAIFDYAKINDADLRDVESMNIDDDIANEYEDDMNTVIKSYEIEESVAEMINDSIIAYKKRIGKDDTLQLAVASNEIICSDDTLHKKCSNIATYSGKKRLLHLYAELTCKSGSDLTDFIYKHVKKLIEKNEDLQTTGGNSALYNYAENINKQDTCNLSQPIKDEIDIIIVPKEGEQKVEIIDGGKL